MANNIEKQIEIIYSEILHSEKSKVACLATTANQNNPPFYIGSIRHTPKIIAANFIFKDLRKLEYIINKFDGIVDYFFVDCEQKNSAKQLLKDSIALIRKSKWHIFKPNDITIEALDAWLTVLRPNWFGKKVVICGIGNIGAKIGFKMAERGASVIFVGRDKTRLDRIADGLNLIIRGAGHINISTKIIESCFNANLILGCTSGIGIITREAIRNMDKHGVIIDVGNGTITPDGIKEINLKNLEAYCLNVQAGFEGFIRCWEVSQTQLSNMRKRKLGDEIQILPVGMIGGYGDVIVDDIHETRQIIGVCDGKGDILSSEKSKPFINIMRKYVKEP